MVCIRTCLFRIPYREWKEEYVEGISRTASPHPLVLARVSNKHPGKCCVEARISSLIEIRSRQVTPGVMLDTFNSAQSLSRVATAFSMTLVDMTPSWKMKKPRLVTNKARLLPLSVTVEPNTPYDCDPNLRPIQSLDIIYHVRLFRRSSKAACGSQTQSQNQFRQFLIQHPLR